MIRKLLHYIVVIVKLTTAFCLVWLAVDLVLWYGGSKEFNWWSVWTPIIAVIIGIPASIGEMALYVKSEERRIKKTPDWKTRYPFAKDFTVKQVADGEYEAALKIWKDYRTQPGTRIVETGFQQRLRELQERKEQKHP